MTKFPPKLQPIPKPRQEQHVDVVEVCKHCGALWREGTTYCAECGGSQEWKHFRVDGTSSGGKR